jgi:hypothetical protein
MSMVHTSVGMRRPRSPHLRSEPAIIAGMARATIPYSRTPWEEYVDRQGIKNLRTLVFLHQDDMESRGLRDFDLVDITSFARDGTTRPCTSSSRSSRPAAGTLRDDQQLRRRRVPVRRIRVIALTLPEPLARLLYEVAASAVRGHQTA